MLRPELRLLGRGKRLGGSELETDRDQPLLSAVVEVALDAAPRLVGRSDHARARGGQLGAALRVCDRGRHELGELRQARLD